MKLDELLAYYSHKISIDLRQEIVIMVQEEKISAGAEGVRLGEANERRRIQVRLFQTLMKEE